MFETELTYIHNDSLRERARLAIESCGDMVRGPASTSGNYHPLDELGEDGQYIHCRRVCWWVNELCKEAKIEGYVRDQMMIAAMFHDIGVNTDTPEKHGLSGAEYLLKHSFFNDSSLVYSFIATHMWHWYPNDPQPQTFAEKVFCFADYIASRRPIHTPFLNIQ